MNILFQKENKKKKDRMRKRSIIFIVFAPVIYIYNVIGNHFDSRGSYKGLTYEHALEYVQAWRVLFGKEYIDNSVKVNLYEYKNKAKKAKFDLDVALTMKELHGSWHIYFNKKKRQIEYDYSTHYGDNKLRITQLGKDDFKIEYYDDTRWNKKRTLFTDYIFDKQQTLDVIKFLKEKYK